MIEYFFSFKMKHKCYFGLLSILIIFFYLVSCTKADQYKNIKDENFIALKMAIDTIKTYSYYRNNVNWNIVEKKIFKDYGNTKFENETYQGIRECFKILHDKHSFLEIKDSLSEDGSPLPIYIKLNDKKHIGYIKINWFSGDKKAEDSYINNLQNEIKRQDNHNMKKWIIDLRGNFGGDMWTMMAGLASFYNENDTLGYSVSNKNIYSYWLYKKDFYEDKNLVFKVGKTYKLKNKPKIAILIDNITASSGEAIAITFKNRPNVKFFGKPTAGVSSGNELFEINDNISLYLTTCLMADASRKIYGDKILPDVLLDFNRRNSKNIVYKYLEDD